MINLTIGETIELQKCRKELRRVLGTLDHLGAGIAAIHVNAAIEQLTGNLEMIEKSRRPVPEPLDFRRIGDSEILH